MDTFFEQIVKVRKTGKDWAIVAAVLVGAIILLYVAALLFFTGLAPVSFLVVCGVFWGAYKLIMLTSVEYEYIFTNGDLDIDKITARASRKRVVSVLCSKAERYGDYNPAAKVSDSVKKTYILCDAADPAAKFIVAPTKKDGMVMIVFAPDDRMKGAIEKSIPRIVR